MPMPNGLQLMLMATGGALMVYITLTTIGRTAMAVAGEAITERRRQEALRRAQDAAAEAAGRAAALEPLALNPDGSIEEPIVAEVEKLAA